MSDTLSDREDVFDLQGFEAADVDHIRMGFGDGDIVPKGLFQHSNGAWSSEPEPARGLWARMKNAGASLHRFLPAKKTEVAAEATEQPPAKKLTTSRLAGVSEFMKDLSSGFGEFFTNAKDAAASLLKKSEDKKPLLQRIRDVGSNLDALSTMGASIGVGVAAKFLIGGTAVATLGAAVAPIAVAIGVSTFVATGMKLRKEYNVSIVEEKKQEAIAAYLDDEKRLGNPQTENPEDALNFISENEYDPRANYGLLRKTGAAALDLFNLKMYAYAYKNKTLARALGYGLGAGLTAGVSAGLTTGVVAGLKHFAHDGFGFGGDNSSADASTNTKPATAAPVAAPVIDFAAVPLAQKLEIVRASIQGEPSEYITNRLAEAADGNAQAIKDIARALYAGEHGVPADQTRAIALYELADAAGNEQAADDLAYIRSLSADHVATTADAPVTAQPDQAIVAPTLRAPLQLDVSTTNVDTVTESNAADGRPNGDLLPVEAGTPRQSLGGRLLAIFNFRGFNPFNSAGSVLQCTPLVENACNINFEAEAGDKIGIQDNLARIDRVATEGQTVGDLLRPASASPEAFAQTQTLLNNMNQAIQNGTPVDDVVPAGYTGTVVATGQTFAGRAPLPSEMGTQFADASSTVIEGANDNQADPAEVPVAMNDNNKGFIAKALASIFVPK